ncbi:hypothetical protein, partial [Beijerinckia sp. L45]|uniref:hypothetical protein n=1 Tax=Beijerinckia sp. L45 TaxID=1641855 RepID=UPI001AEE648C
MAALVCVILTIAEQRILPSLGFMGKATTTAFVFAGLIEETAKLTVTLVFIYP